MHEMSVAVQLVSQVEMSAMMNNVARVTSVTVDIGMMQLIVPEALAVAFEFAAQGTCAEGAELVINEVPALAKCGSCDNEYVPEIANYMCPKCLKADAEIIQGKDMILKSMECETEEECAT